MNTTTSSGCLIVDSLRAKTLANAQEDPIVLSVLDKIVERARAGQKKYGTNLARHDLTRLQWLRHAQEEAMDLANYLEVLILRDGDNMSPYHDLQETALEIACNIECDINHEQVTPLENKACAEAGG